ncbi:MAG: hypothetical protein ACOYT7_02345 [Patescibacteria group bacterium]
MVERQLLIIRPLGAQGPKIGIKISEIGDIIAFDLALGELTDKQKETVTGVLSAADRAGLEVVDCSPLPDQDTLDEIGLESSG